MSPSCLPSFVILATSLVSRGGQICVLAQVTLAHTHTHSHTRTHARTTSVTRNRNELKRSNNVFVALFLPLSFCFSSSADSPLFVQTNEAHHVPTQLWFIFTTSPNHNPSPYPSTHLAGTDCAGVAGVCLAGWPAFAASSLAWPNKRAMKMAKIVFANHVQLCVNIGHVAQAREK